MTSFLDMRKPRKSLVTNDSCSNKRTIRMNTKEFIRASYGKFGLSGKFLKSFITRKKGQTLR